MQIDDKETNTDVNNLYNILKLFYQGIAWIVGYIAGDFTLTFYGWSVGLVLSLMVS